MDGSGSGPGSGSDPSSSSSTSTWSDVLGDVCSGIAVGIGHPKWFVEKKILGAGWDAVASALASLTGGVRPTPAGAAGGGDEAASENGTGSGSGGSGGASTGSTGLKVAGVGYGRTGTYSLALALDALGYPTLHTQHLYENADLFDHWVSNVFYKSIADDRITMGEPDFDLLGRAGYVATMDLPFALYFDQIRERYPDCKFILTVRESSDVWFRSWDVLTRSITQPARYTSFIFTHVKKLEHYMRWLFSVVNEDETYLSHPFPLPPQNRERAVASYERHNQRVRDTIPPSHLLEYNVRQGWEPLCRFLEVEDCPTASPFPRSNSARAVRWQSYSAFVGPLVLSVCVVASILAFVFRKVTGVRFVEWCSTRRVRRADGPTDRGKKGR